MIYKIIIPFLCGIISHASSSIVDTQYGQVSGHFINVNNGRDPVMPIEVFHTVPFAKDTSGPRRFAKPEPRDPWTGVYDAATIGTACPQSENGVIAITHPDWDNFGEDCLHVSIYTKDVTGGPYPVMLWIHGGGYTAGANIQYPGHFLATRDVVVVTANYRLEEFGFMYCGSDTCPGNYGMWDQNMALQFVVDNIANFGGDPNKITVFGESAGATSTAMHVVSPFSKDLFQQAIMESGAGTNSWAVDLDPENNLPGFAFSLGCLGADEEESIACLRTKTWQDIRENGSCSGCSSPVVDGPDGFIPDSPRALREQGNIMNGPLIAGINHDESATSLAGIVPGTLAGCCNRTYFQYLLENRFTEMFIPNDADNVTKDDAYHALDFNYTPWPDIYDNHQNRDAMERILTDTSFGYAWDNELKFHQAAGPTWGYVYNYRGRNMTQLIPEWMGVPHIGEIPFIWGITLLPFNQEVIDDSQIQFDLVHWTNEDVMHTIFAQDLWANFAKFGNPTPTPVDNPLGGTTVWPQFTWEDMNVLEIKNTSIDSVKEWIQQDYAFWTEYFPFIAYDISPGPYPLHAKEDEGTTDDLDVGNFLSWVVEARRSGLDLDLEDEDYMSTLFD